MGISLLMLPKRSSELSEPDPEASKNAESFVRFRWQWLGKDPPYQVKPEELQYIIHTSAQFHIWFSAQFTERMAWCKVQ